MLGLVAWAALVLAALIPVPTRADVFGGDDSHWRAVPSTVQSTTVSLAGLGCAAGAIGRVLTAGQRVELFFEGTDLELYGVPAPSDVHVQYLLDFDEQQAPDPTTNVDAPVSACRLISGFHSLANKLHNLTILVNPSDSDSFFQYIIANATTIDNNDADSSSKTISINSNTTSSQTSASASGTELSNSSSGSPVVNTSPGNKHNALIAGVAIGGLILFFATGFGIYALVRRRRNRVPPSAAFRARMARAEFVMVNAENNRSETPLPSSVV